MLIPTWCSSTGQEEGMEGGMVTPAPALVRFTGIQKTYDGEHLVVKNLDLDIRKGEFITLLGPSGSGKTTTLMMLAGFEVPTRGEIYLADRSIKKMTPHDRGEYRLPALRSQRQQGGSAGARQRGVAHDQDGNHGAAAARAAVRRSAA